jgi:HD-like signal output (HDOD) protein
MTPQSHPVSTPIYRAGLQPDAIMQRLEQLWTRPRFVPASTPIVARELVRLASFSYVEWHEARRLFEMDPMLAAVLMRRASRVHPVATVPQALELLGLPAVRDLLIELSRKLQVVQDPDLLELISAVQLHSWRVSQVAGLVGRYTTLSTERVQAQAQLADLGLLAGAMVAAEIGSEPLARVLPMLQAGHATLSWYLAQAWGLAPELRDVIGHHHGLRVEGYAHPECAALIVASAVVEDMGLELRVRGLPHLSAAEELAEALEALGLTPRQFLLVRRAGREALMG